MMQGNIQRPRKSSHKSSTRAIFDGTPGQKPRIEFVENLSTSPRFCNLCSLFTDAGLQPDFAEQVSSDASSTKAIYHGSRPTIYSPTGSSTASTASPLPRLAALRGMSYRDQRLELGGVNTHQQAPDITEWQNATEDGDSATSDEPWTGGKEDQTSVTESTVAEEMEEQKTEGGQEMSGEEVERRRKMSATEKGKSVSN